MHYNLEYLSQEKEKGIIRDVRGKRGGGVVKEEDQHRVRTREMF